MQRSDDVFGRAAGENEVEQKRARVILRAMSGVVWSETALILPVEITDNMLFDDTGASLSLHRVELVIGATPVPLMHFKIEPEMQKAGEVHLTIAIHGPRLVNARLKCPHLFGVGRVLQGQAAPASYGGHRKW